MPFINAAQIYTAHSGQSPQWGRGQHRIGMISCQASPPPHDCHQTHWGDCREWKNAARNKARGKQKRKRNQSQRKLGKEKEQSQRKLGKKKEQSQREGKGTKPEGRKRNKARGNLEEERRKERTPN